MPSLRCKNSGFLKYIDTPICQKPTPSLSPRLLYKTFALLLSSFLIMQAVYIARAEELDSQPIEILSDVLKYYPQAKKAIFEGKVDATQGDMKITCDKMIVNLKEANSPKIADKQNGTSNITSGQINDIQLEGKVVILTDKDKAEAEHGEYILDSSMLYLYDEVKLYQGKNQLFGDKLTYNKKTGESLVTTSSKDNKVRGIFITEDKDASR